MSAPDGSASALPPLVEPGPPLTPQEATRYARHAILPGIGVDGQRRLRHARVLVIGAGGLGSPALLYLAAAGIGTLGVVDDDVVEVSNLQRQVIHGVPDVGRPKVESARDAIARLDPSIRVQTHRTRLTAANALDILRGYDLVLDGADNFATRYLVADAGEILGLPCVWGSILRWDGQVSVFWPGRGAVYRDVFPDPPDPALVPSCAEAGVLGLLCASIGAAMGTEAVKLVTGIGRPLVGRLLVHDALAARWSELTLRPDPARVPVTRLADSYEFACAAPEPERPAVTAAELRAMLDRRTTGEADVDLVDVREPAEWEIVKIPGARLVPKDEILRGDALSSMPNDRQIVMYCKTGVRSAETLAAVKAAGFRDAVHVQGGVTAWVNQVDPSLPSY